MIKMRSIVILVTTITLVVTGCKNLKLTNPHLTLGNPSGASNSNPNNYLMVVSQYAVSYNCQLGIPNWVSWQLNKSWIGSVERQDDFKPNANLPEGCYQVKTQDYTGSGYDRGHMIPSADRTLNPQDNESTFLMTNIIPQSPANNREVWRELEEYSRKLAFEGKELYIIAGADGKEKTLAKGKVTVPKYTWKIIVVLDKPGDKITEQTRVIAVRMPNSEKVARSDWQDYLVSVDKLEDVTGYDFFSNISTPVQNVLEKKIDRP